MSGLFQLDQRGRLENKLKVALERIEEGVQLDGFRVRLARTAIHFECLRKQDDTRAGAPDLLKIGPHRMIRLERLDGDR
jgi:hypothetical protein